MLYATLCTLATIAAVVATISGVSYQFRCAALEKHLRGERPDYRTEAEAFVVWRNKRWALDKLRLRFGLAVIISYAVGMAALIPMQSMLKAAETPSNIPSILIGLLSLGMLAVGLRSIVHNDRLQTMEFDRRMDDIQLRARSRKRID
jgi:hypothetical protein